MGARRPQQQQQQQPIGIRRQDVGVISDRSVAWRRNVHKNVWDGKSGVSDCSPPLRRSTYHQLDRTCVIAARRRIALPLSLFVRRCSAL